MKWKWNPFLVRLIPNLALMSSSPSISFLLHLSSHFAVSCFIMFNILMVAFNVMPSYVSVLLIFILYLENTHMCLYIDVLWLRNGYDLLNSCLLSYQMELISCVCEWVHSYTLSGCCVVWFRANIVHVERVE